jgi:hypothetical protein
LRIALERLRTAPLASEPFDHVVVPRFVTPEALAEALRDFPRIHRGGSFPKGELDCGPAFSELLDELEDAPLRRAVEEKFELELAGRPTMITVRGRSRRKDGRVHTDSRSKIVTVLVYMNPAWSDPGGRLRLLRSGASLDDYTAEVVPELGTAVFFRCTENAWHGHTPFVGERRAIQLNWVTDEGVVRREQARHGLSARLKKLFA